MREGGEAASEIHCEGRARACEVNVCEGSGVKCVARMCGGSHEGACVRGEGARVRDGACVRGEGGTVCEGRANVQNFPGGQAPRTPQFCELENV